MTLATRHIMRIEDLTPEEIVLILDTAESFKEVNERRIKKLPTLRGRTVVNLFLEPSTRTRTSFEIAAKRLSADGINFTASASATVATLPRRTRTWRWTCEIGHPPHHAHRGPHS